MKKAFIGAIGIALIIVSLVEIQAIEVANATYTIESGFTQVVVQSPTSNASYNASSDKLIVYVGLIYGTSSPIDEFSLENITCRYSIDGGERINFTSMYVTSNIASPSVNFWKGLLHKLNITMVSELRPPSDGLHFVEIRLNTNDSWGGYEDVAQTNFTTNAHAITTQSPTPTAFSTPSLSTTQQPKVSILYPLNDSFFNVSLGGVSFPLTYETNSNLSWVGYSIDGSQNWTLPGNGTHVLPISGYNGYNSLTLYANDTSGNWATPQTVTYLVNINPDYTPTPSPSPTLQPTNPPLHIHMSSLPFQIAPILLVVFLLAVIAVLICYFEYHGTKKRVLKEGS